ncbi:MAG TPA: barstar family protein [Mucilaginibacter sp.]|jgi:RNAse (barnase) inhibitor barstar|nr:barstar family protein [Mucilaginibacter sp.]
MDNFIFVDDHRDYSPTNVFVAYVANVSDREQLFAELFFSLKFPDYFGFNWDALYDLLRDFSWIKQRDIVLVHGGLSNLEPTTLKKYLEVLQDSVASWTDNDPHSFQVVFSRSDKERLENIY